MMGEYEAIVVATEVRCDRVLVVWEWTGGGEDETKRLFISVQKIACVAGAAIWGWANILV
jgi:hypothetical protein